MSRHIVSESNLETVYWCVDGDGYDHFEVYHKPSDTHFDQYDKYVTQHLLGFPNPITNPKRNWLVPLTVFSSVAASVGSVILLTHVYH